MLKQRGKDLLLAALIVALVVLSSYLVIGFNRVAAQDQDGEGTNAELAYSRERKQGQLEVPASRGSLAVSSLGAHLGVARPRWLATGAGADQEPDAGPDTDIAYQDADTNVTYQGVFTDEVDYSSRDRERQEGQLEVLGDDGGAPPIGAQSTGSGDEYVPVSAFRHEGFVGPASEFLISPVDGFILNKSTTEQMCMSGPVYLPHGATITEFSMYFVDDHATSDVWSDFYRRKHSDPPDSSAELVADLFFPGFDFSFNLRGFTSYIEPGTETVSNQYGYYIAFCFDANTGFEQRMYGFRVRYTQ
jgi:hypothetical protein